MALRAGTCTARTSSYPVLAPNYDKVQCLHLSRGAEGPTRSETVATADRLLGTLARPASPGTRARSSCLEMRGWLHARTHACISHLESGVRETLSVGEAKQKNCKHWQHRPLVESRDTTQKKSKARCSTLDLPGARSRLKKKSGHDLLSS